LGGKTLNRLTENMRTHAAIITSVRGSSAAPRKSTRDMSTCRLFSFSGESLPRSEKSYTTQQMLTFWTKASSLDRTSVPAPPAGGGGESFGFPVAPFFRGGGFAGGEPPPPELDLIDFHDSLPINCFHMAARSGGSDTTLNRADLTATGTIPASPEHGGANPGGRRKDHTFATARNADGFSCNNGEGTPVTPQTRRIKKAHRKDGKSKGRAGPRNQYGRKHDGTGHARRGSGNGGVRARSVGGMRRPWMGSRERGKQGGEVGNFLAF
jgi:hypothetical protein